MRISDWSSDVCSSDLHVHFTPTSASWINQVERWFAELTRKQLQRGVHRPTAELEADIAAFIKMHNANPKPYKWVKSAADILAAVKRFCQKTITLPSVLRDLKCYVTFSTKVARRMTGRLALIKVRY